jgi:PhzF family phenazine biosynthesis protein
MNQTHENTRNVPVHIVNAFVKQGVGGNPAGVVLDADGYSEDEKLSIAQKVGLSETAFVSESKTEGFKLDFFTPTKRIAHCGHATIATFSYLASLELVSDGQTSKETVDGPRKIILDKGMAYMEQLAPSYQEIELVPVLDSLGLSDDDLDINIQPLLVNTGNSFIVLAVKDKQTLQAIKPKLDLINEISEQLDLVGYYVFTTDSNELDATARMFAPRYGIIEEAATGMAAGPLACVLWDKAGLNKTTIHIGQGDFMKEPSPSLITVNLEVDNGQVTGLLSGGYGQVMKDMVVSI